MPDNRVTIHKKIIKKQKIITSSKTSNKTKIAQKISYNDIEEFIISEIITQKIKSSIKLPINTIIFNLTESMKKLSYKQGYSIGRIIYLNYGDTDKLLDFIESGGIGNLFYYPYGDLSIIKTRSLPSINCGANIHFYEAGIMAGYFSAYMGKNLNVIETKCVNNGALECQFNVSSSLIEPQFSKKLIISPVSLISQALNSLQDNSVCSSYTILSFLSILQSKNILHSLSKLLFVSGYEFSNYYTYKNFDEGLSKISQYIGVQIQKQPKNTKAKKYIYIKYNKYNSIQEYVTLTSNIFIGFIKGVTKKEALINININKDSVYILKINLGST